MIAGKVKKGLIELMQHIPVNLLQIIKAGFHLEFEYGRVRTDL